MQLVLRDESRRSCAWKRKSSEVVKRSAKSFENHVPGRDPLFGNSEGSLEEHTRYISHEADFQRAHKAQADWQGDLDSEDICDKQKGRHLVA
jgi:hypothetical protein